MSYGDFSYIPSPSPKSPIQQSGKHLPHIDILSEAPHTPLTFCQDEATGKCFAYKLAYLNNEKKGDKI